MLPLLLVNAALPFLFPTDKFIYSRALFVPCFPTDVRCCVNISMLLKKFLVTFRAASVQFGRERHAVVSSDTKRRSVSVYRNKLLLLLLLLPRDVMHSDKPLRFPVFVPPSSPPRVCLPVCL